MSHSLIKLTLVLLISALFSSTALALKPIYSGGKERAAIRGYDVVAYFTEDMAVQGTREFALKYRGAVWYFSSEQNKDLFRSNPKKYVPQYGGYCAYSMARESIASTKPKYFTIHNDKLYLNYNKATFKRWRKKKDEYIAKADDSWPIMLAK